jgi:hypothetical protein
MGWTGLVAAAPDASGEWSTTALEREPDVDSIARELAQVRSAAIVCFVYDSDVGYAVADAADGKSARIVINEPAAREYGMEDDLPLGRSADAAVELAAWASEHGLKQVDPEALRAVLEADHVFAEEGAAQVFELLGLKWDDDAPGV